MKKFLKNRILPFVSALSILISLCVIPVSASEPGWGSSDGLDLSSTYAWEGKVQNANSAFVAAFCASQGVAVSPANAFWEFVNPMIERVGYGEINYQDLETACERFNDVFRSVDGGNVMQFLLGEFRAFLTNSVAVAFGLTETHFVVKKHESSGYLRIYEEKYGLWVVNSSGQYPCALGSQSGPTAYGNKWVGERSCSTAQVNMQDSASLSALNAMIIDSGTPSQIRALGKYKAIWYNRQYYCDAQGRPFVAPADEDKWAVNQERPATSIVDGDGNTVIVGGAGGVVNVTPTLDLGGLTVTLPDGTINLIDEVIYDESTKTYNFDSHDVVNIYQTYNYSWTYHINYTSITYIGQTEEYNKYYEVYYELPDGRSSADLTREELEQLNVSIDVIPYGRSADDTSLRSLYHFDGDTRDASYWNYCTDFTWNKGASLTYMDAGVFNGALYLDEQEHDFTLTLPSAFGTRDFTLQFRYYQSYTAAPQTDSYIKLGDSTVFQFNGGQFLNGSGTSLANTPIGTWNEIALIRDSGTLYYYLNGVSIGSISSSVLYSNTVTFHFGSSQQTYKYFDELRILNYALQNGGSNYTPTSVPYDTNLALVLPTDSLPVADEYWSWDTTVTPTKSYDLTSGSLDCFSSSLTSGKFVTCGSVVSDTGFVTLTGSSSAKSFSYTTTRGNYSASISVSSTGLIYMFDMDSMFKAYNASFPTSYYGSSLSTALPAGTYVFTLVDSDGNLYHVPFSYSIGSASTSSYTNVLGSLETDWGSIKVYNCNRYVVSNNSSFYFSVRYAYLDIAVASGKSVDIVYAEFVPGSTPNTGHEHVTSVSAMTPDQLNTPTLAVRTDLDITSYQIGGVRPSLPKKGQVWAMVESGYITSIQVYNGSAWEACDGRIWTGQRWIPARSYNVITLQDMYDVADATPNYEYIYSESGFWSWWQKSWNSFVERFFASGGGSGGNVDIDADIVVGNPDEEDEQSLWQFLSLVVSGGKSLVGGVRYMFSGVVSLIPDSVQVIQGAFDSGGVAVGVMDGSASDPDAGEMPATFGMIDESEVKDPWRYR